MMKSKFTQFVNILLFCILTNTVLLAQITKQMASGKQATTIVNAFKNASKTKNFEVQLAEFNFKFQEVDNGLPQSLKAKYPQIKLYRGVSTSNNELIATVTIANDKVKGTILDDAHITSFSGNKNEISFSYDSSLKSCGICKNSHKEHTDSHLPTPIVDGFSNSDKNAKVSNNTETALASYSRGGTYRNFKIAMVMSYWQCQRLNISTLTEGMAYITERLAMFNEVWGKDLAVRFELAPNSDKIIYLNASDIFPEQDFPNTAFDLFPSTKTVLDAEVGFDNYDVGFLFHPTGTGWAGGRVCTNGKHAGVASANDDGLVLHELGHQFAGVHTYHLDASVEIPNLSTCVVGANGGRSRWFHSVNFEIVGAWIDSQTCGTSGATGNTIPSITLISPNNVYIPKGTPFALKGSATDPDPTAVLTHAWQHINVSESDPTNPTLKLLWANKKPAEDGAIRYIPDYPSLIANTPDVYSKLPTVSRPIVTRYIVRDNQEPYGATTYQELTLNVDDTAGPFLVKYPNNSIALTGLQNINITWDIANTNNAQVNVQQVNIFLSTDEGATWTNIGTNVPNNGSFAYTLPDISSTKCRIKIEAVGNLFLDISDKNFTIVPSTTNDFVFTAQDDSFEANYNETTANFAFYFAKVGVFNNSVNVSVSGTPAGATVVVPAQLTASGDFNVVLQNANVVAPGKYPMTITLTEVGGSIVKTLPFIYVKKTLGDGIVGKALRVVQEDKAMLATIRNITSNTFTMSTWVKPTQTGRDWYRSGLLYFEKTGIYINPAGELGFIYNDFYGKGNLAKVTFNQWNHVALVVEPSLAKLYLNGVKIGELAASYNPINLGTTLKVGKREWFATVLGDYDEVKIFDKSLSQIEVREEMHRNINYENPNLIHYYQFNETSGNPVSPVSFDATVLENTATLVPSTVPTGDAVVSSLPQTTTLTDFTGTNVSLKFANNSTDLATVHKINLSPNTLADIPTTQTNAHPGSYWEVNSYAGSGNTITDAVFKVTYDIQPSETADKFVLYKRSQTADGTWVITAVGNSVDAATNSVTFKNLEPNNQYMVYQSTDPAVDIIEVDVTSDCFLTVNNNKVFEYQIQGTNLTAPLSLSFDNADYTLSLNASSGFAPTLQLSPVNGSVQQTVYAKYVGTSTGSLSSVLSASSTGALTQTSVLSFIFKKDAYNRGNAMVFDGTDDRVQLSNLKWQPTVFSAEFWYKPNNDFRYWNHKIGNDGQFFFHSDGNRIVKIGTANTTAGSMSTPNNTLEADKWIHVAYTFDNGSSKLYLNGKLTMSKTGVPVPDKWDNWAIGINGNNTLNGMLDEFRIWSTARTEKQIQENMHLINDLSAACAEGLIAYYQFENTTGGIVEDMAGAYTGTVLGNSTIAESKAAIGLGVALQQNITGTNGDYSSEDFSFSSAASPNGLVTASKITQAPYSPPIVANTTGTDKFWAIHNYGTALAANTANLTFKPGVAVTAADVAEPLTYDLYYRPLNSDIAWVKVKNADLSSEANNTVTFNNVNLEGQYMVLKNTGPILKLTAIDGIFDCPVTPNNNSETTHFQVQGSKLEGPVTFTFNNTEFLISTNPTSGFASQLSLSPSSGSLPLTDIYVKAAPTGTGTITGVLTIASTNAISQTQNLSYSALKDIYNRGNAMVFDGLNDRVTIPNLSWQPTAFTVEMWYKPANHFFYWNHFSGNPGQFFFHSDGAKALKMGTFNNDQSSIYSPNNILTADKWHHLAFTYNNGTAAMYVNGALIQSKTGVQAPDTWNNWRLGSPTESSLHGELDEFRIWSTARTQQQIQDNMHLINDLKNACAEGLKLYYQFETNQGSVVEDALGLYSGTIGDNPTLAPSSAPVGFGKSETHEATAASTYDYPQAKASLNFAGTAPNGRVVVSHITGTPPYAPPTTTGLLANEYWIIDNYGTNTGLNATATFTPPTGWVNSTTLSNFTYQKRGTNEFGIWTAPLAATQVGTNTVSFGGITSFSQFVIANTAAPLPIDLLGFFGNQINDQIQLSWKTANEKDFSHFEVQKSTDAKEFGTIAKVQGSKANTYNAIDSNPVEGTNYYRLKMVDLNGSTKLSNIVQVNFENDNSFISVENPAKNGEFKVNTNIKNPRFILYNSLGGKVNIDIIYRGNYTYLFKSKKAIPGIYFLHAEAEGKIHTRRVLLP